MNKTLINNIKTQLFSAVSAYTTTDVYFLIIPNEQVLDRFNTVFELTTKDITHTFDTKELVMDYEVSIWVNNKTRYETILDSVVFIKEQIYKLVDVNPSVQVVNLTDEELTYNFDMSVYTAQLKFDIQFTK